MPGRAEELGDICLVAGVFSAIIALSAYFRLVPFVVAVMSPCSWYRFSGRLQLL